MLNFLCLEIFIHFIKKLTSIKTHGVPFLIDSKTVFIVPIPPCSTKTTIGMSPASGSLRFDIAASSCARKSISPPNETFALSTRIKWE